MTVSEQIIIGMRRTGISRKELALRIGMSESSLRSRLSHPEWFRLVELRKIARILGQELEVKV